MGTISEKPNNKISSRRIIIMDELRGIAVFCMVFYHLFFQLSELFHFDFGSKLLTFFMPLQPIFAALFIIISGISSRLSKSNFKRGSKLFLIALAFFGVTVYVLPLAGIESAKIYFGILHLLSICMLLFALLRPLLDKIKPETGVLISMVLYLLTYNVTQGYIGLFNIFKINLPEYLYNTSFLFPFGFFNSTFFSADYFPLFPYFFIFITGTFLGINIVNGTLPEWSYKTRVRFFAFVGRSALIIYVLHNPLIYGLIKIIDLIVN